MHMNAKGSFYIKCYVGNTLTAAEVAPGKPLIIYNAEWPLS